MKRRHSIAPALAARGPGDLPLGRRKGRSQHQARPKCDAIGFIGVKMSGKGDNWSSIINFVSTNKGQGLPRVGVDTGRNLSIDPILLGAWLT